LPFSLTYIALFDIGTKKQPKGYWKDPENRKQFLVSLAEGMGADPADPATWRHVTVEMVHAKKVCIVLTFFPNQPPC